MSLCVFTFNSFCRRPRAAHSSSHSSIQHNIKRNPGAPCLAPLTLLLLSEVGRRRVEGRWVNNERARQEKRRSFANFSTFPPLFPPPPTSPLPPPLYVAPPSLSLIFPPVHPRAPTLTRLRMDRNSEKLIFLRRPPPSRPFEPRSRFCFHLSHPAADLYLSRVYSAPQLRRRRKRMRSRVSPSGRG